MAFSIGPYDLLAPTVLLVGWSAYTRFADREDTHRVSLMSVMHRHRRRWMRQMLARENRMVDAQIMRGMMRSVSLFASISVFVVGGLLAALGVPEATRQLITDLPFVAPTSAALWQTKVLFMATLFVYAFFKFAWSLRQFNYTASMLGAAPPPEETASHGAYAEAIADLGSLAVKSYNGGMRAYYFGLAALTWFLHPIALVVAVLWVIAIVYRREFKSRTLAALQRTLSVDN